MGRTLWRAVESGSLGMKKGRVPKHPPLSRRRSVRRQRQRVVMRKPMKAMPNPIRMFHGPRSAMGQAPPET